MMGDGGFWHNGLTSGIANAVFNRSDNLTLIVDNNYTAATGGQDILSSRAGNRTRSTGHAIEKAVRGVGVDWVRTIRRTYDVAGMRAALREALTTQAAGPEGDHRAERMHAQPPAAREAAGAEGHRRRRARGARALRRRHRHLHRRPFLHPLSGCPSLTIKPNPDPLRSDPVATVLDSCVGCGLCGEVSHAAVLCPSFYRAEVVSNPSRWDRCARRCAAR